MSTHRSRDSRRCGSALLLALPSLLLVFSLAAAGPGVAAEPDYIYIGVYEEDVPFVDYEGDGAVEALGTRQTRPGDPFRLEVVVAPAGISIGGAKAPTAAKKRLRFSGQARRSGREGFRLEGTLECRSPVVVQFVQMTRQGDPSGETFPELSFGSGRHAIRFEGRVVGWLER